MDLEKVEQMYCYVDAWYPGVKWFRIKISEIDEKVRVPSGNKDCCVSMQRYISAVPMDNDPHISDFAIDIDHSQDLEQALADTKKVHAYLRDMKMGYDYPEVYYSGSKGFHLITPWQVLGARPANDLYEKYKMAAEQIQHATGVKTIDFSLYAKEKQLRLPNSINTKSGRYKHRIPTDVFQELSLADIQSLADHESNVISDYDPHECDYPVQWWQDILERHREKVENEKLAPTVSINIRPDGMPTCIQYLWENGAPAGVRNKATMNMVSFFKDQKRTKPQATRAITEWVRNHFSGDRRKLTNAIAGAKAVVNTIYDNKKRYFFSCNYIHGCNTGAFRVPCVTADRCPYVEKAEDQAPKQTPVISLYDASHGRYVGIESEVPVNVVAKEDSPYFIPSIITAQCHIGNEQDRTDSVCSRCVLQHAADSTYEYSPSIDNRDTLNLFQLQDHKVRAAIRQHLGIGKNCRVASLRFSESQTNITVVYMVPMITDGIKAGDYVDDELSGGYVMRKGYFMGHNVESNRDYYAVMKTHSHPKDQIATHLIKELRPAASSIDTFDPSEEVLDRLRVFQVGPNESVDQKMQAIHADLEHNVHQIRGRTDVAIIMDLFYHSVLRFKFAGRTVEKGWFELVVMGDPGEGKSEMAKRLRWHYQLGEWVGGETSARTGLMHSVQKNDKQRWFIKWGKIPQNDRGLVIIDEFSGVDKELWGEATEMRSSGFLAVNKAASAETLARTRLMCITNPVAGKDLGDYRFGIEAVPPLYHDFADTRRIDVVCGLKKGDLAHDVYNTLYDTVFPHTYTSELCKNLVLWTWSRKPHQVKLTKEAEDRILKYSKQLADKYGGTSIYVVSASDMKFKLARIAVAVAARLFSTDSKFENLFVTEEHVRYAARKIQHLYDSKALRYDDYAREYSTQMEPTKAMIENVQNLFESVANREVMVTVSHLVRFFKTGDEYTNRSLLDYYSMSQNNCSAIWSEFISSGLLKRGKHYLYRTPLLLQILDKIRIPGEENSKQPLTFE